MGAPLELPYLLHEMSTTCEQVSAAPLASHTPWRRHFLRLDLACGVRRHWWGKETSGGCGM
jgi:hypothetical protein